MGKPLSRPGCFRRSSCCLEKHGAGDVGMGGRVLGMETRYGDGYIPQRSIYDPMCMNEQIDRRDFGGEGGFSYSASGSLRVCRSPVDMCDPQPRSLTPNPSFVRRLDERAIYDSLKLGCQDIDGNGCPSPGHFSRSASPSVSSFSAPGVSSSSKKHHHHYHHHHGDSTKSRDGRQSWKVLTPPKHLESLELTTPELIDRGSGCLNPGQYPPPGGQSLTSSLISPFSASPLSSGYHTPVFFSPAKPRPSQSQSLRCSPPHVVQPRHYSQTQSLRLSPPHELRRSPYRTPLVQLSVHDLEQDLRDRAGWGRSEREREWEREREREMERGWTQREWERERERGRLQRERARERERRETSTFGTFGYGRAVPLCSERDSVFLEPDQVLDTAPLLFPQPSPSPSPNAAPRMGTGAVGRNRAGSKVGPESLGGVMVSHKDNGSVSLVLVDSKHGCGPRLVSEIAVGNMSEAEIRAGINRDESWNKYDNGSKTSIKNGSETRMGSQVKTRPGGRDLEGRVQSGMENSASALNKDRNRGGSKTGRPVTKSECITDAKPTPVTCFESEVKDNVEVEAESHSGMKPMMDAEVEAKATSKQMETRTATEPGVVAKVNNEVVSEAESRPETNVEIERKIPTTSETKEVVTSGVSNETVAMKNTEMREAAEKQTSQNTDKSQTAVARVDQKDPNPTIKADNQPLDIEPVELHQKENSSKSQKSRSSKSSSRTRPGTATGVQPGVVSPSPNRRLGDLESTCPTEGIESTWPRRIMVRKRTVRQGGALHNLPILPPLPSVLSALEKRRPHGHLHPHPGHFSENQLSNKANPASIVGRCSLKEPSHSEPGQGSSLVGRASLKEQNLEHWRVFRDLNEPRRSRSKEKHGQQTNKANEQESNVQGKNGDQGGRDEKMATEEGRGDNGLVENKRGKSTEEKLQNNRDKNEYVKRDNDADMSEERVEEKDKGNAKEEAHKQHLKEAAAGKTEAGVMEGGDGETEEGDVESWDEVLEMVTTLWDAGWEKGGTGEEDDPDFTSDSLQRWPLLRPPVGFGGSHPPSSAASELSLTELERRARELDSDLEHLDLSQPHQDVLDLYQTPTEPQRERADMYQTHPGPQREKTALTTVGSRSQVSLELGALASSTSDPNRSPGDWSSTSARTCAAVTSSNKEDSSPDSNLTLESESSGIFLSSSNQSQEEGGSDSDQPISGSDLGSSNTSLEKDSDDGGLKEWGREESAELQWCYPSLLNTSQHEDIDADAEREEAGLPNTGGGAEKNLYKTEEQDGHLGLSITKNPPGHSDTADSTVLRASLSETVPTRKRVSIMGGDFPLPLSPSKPLIKQLQDPTQKPTRPPGLHCGDFDPFVQSDSFVYLAVSARPGPQSEGTRVADGPVHGTAKRESPQQHLDGKKAAVSQSNPEWEAKMTQMAPQKPEEVDFLCTDSFVYLAAPACFLLGPDGTTSYTGRDSDSESSGSGPVDVSVYGCGSVAGDSDWDSDLSDSDPTRSSRNSASAGKCSSTARSKRPPAELGWDEETTEPEVPTEPSGPQDKARKVSEVTTSMAATQGVPMATNPTVSKNAGTPTEHSATTKKVTWQFKPAQRSVCTGSKKEREKEVKSPSMARFMERGPSSSSSSSSSSSTSSSPSS